MTKSGLLDLPLEILHKILDILDLASVYQLGAACRGLHRLIHQVFIDIHVGPDNTFLILKLKLDENI